MNNWWDSLEFPRRPGVLFDDVSRIPMELIQRRELHGFDRLEYVYLYRVATW